MKKPYQRVSIVNKDEGGNRRGVFWFLFLPGRKKETPSRRGDKKNKFSKELIRLQLIYS